MKHLSYLRRNRKTASCLAVALTSIIAFAQPGLATTFYVDPVNGNMANDGSQANPWSTLEEVFTDNLIETQEYSPTPYVEGVSALIPKNVGAPVKAGDTILLLSGDHGTVNQKKYYNSSEITIEAAPGATPVIRRFLLQAAMNWRLRGVTVSPEPSGSLGTKYKLIEIVDHFKFGPNSNIIVEDCHVYTVDDSSAWTATDWTSLACSGIRVEGPGGVIRNNVVRNVSGGINCSSYGLVEYNEIINFSGDGMRGGGDYSTFQYNLVMNNYNVDGNHDDGYQSWAGEAGTKYGIVLRGNTIIQNDGSVPPELAGALQGIGCFDGFYEDWVVENNLIIAEARHGIALYGAINCTVANNTVVDRVVVAGKKSPWIHVTAHKNGTPSSGNTIVNNVATGLAIGSNVGGTELNNLKIDHENFATIFADHENFNYSLAPGSPLIDAGTSVSAPPLDIDGTSRPQGAGWDLGAYEFVDSILLPGDSADQQVRSNGGMHGAGQPDARVGGHSTGTDAALVLVFALPALEPGEVVLDASLHVELLKDSAGLAANYDLHGLPYRQASAVQIADYYQGAFGSDPASTPIQDDFILQTTPVGPVASSPSTSMALADYIQAQFAAGAQPGDYVFLRINADIADVPDYKYCEIATANNPTESFRPVLAIWTGPAQ